MRIRPAEQAHVDPAAGVDAQVGRHQPRVLDEMEEAEELGPRVVGQPEDMADQLGPEHRPGLVRVGAALDAVVVVADIVHSHHELSL
jgi:hypothetical protein